MGRNGIKIKKLFLDVEKRYEIEVNTYQQRVNRIQSELDKATNDMKKHLAEYKNLMSVKQSLEKVKRRKSMQDCWINSFYHFYQTNLSHFLSLPVPIQISFCNSGN